MSTQQSKLKSSVLMTHNPEGKKFPYTAAGKKAAAKKRKPKKKS